MGGGQELFELANDLKDDNGIHSVLPEKKVQKIMEEKKEDDRVSEEFVLDNSSGRDVAFSGYLIGSAWSRANNACSNYSGSTGRWQKLRIYETVGGKYVCQKVDLTQWQGERTRYKVAVYDSKEEIYAFFGSGWLAKELYEEAGLPDAIRVD